MGGGFCGGEFLEDAELFVFHDVVPGEVATVHGDVDAGWEGLGIGEGTTEVEEAVTAAEAVGDHRAGEHNGFIGDDVSEESCGVCHGVGAVGDDDAVFGGLSAAVQDALSVCFCHGEAVFHHDGVDDDFEVAVAEFQHLGDVGFSEEEGAVQFIVLFVECASGDHDADFGDHCGLSLRVAGR